VHFAAICHPLAMEKLADKFKKKPLFPGKALTGRQYLENGQRRLKPSETMV